ncbi:MAG: ribonuclease III [Planctomycetota bacterium]|nr:ribonuclease III [Planctomycetota bacterium]
MDLGHEFRDAGLLVLALTHASADREQNNERLEFLGDTVLDLVAAEELFERLPDGSEGDLSAAKAWLVSRKTLAAAARELKLAEVARFGAGLERLVVPTSVLANLYEAVLGAVYLDGGLEAARRFALASLADSFARAAQAGHTQNHKQRLQEWAQSGGGQPPSYELLQKRGDDHRRSFQIRADVHGRSFPAAWGRTRREAEAFAAREAMLQLSLEANASAESSP